MATQIGSGSTLLATYIPDLTDTANVQTALKQLYYGTTGGTLSTTTGIYGALYTLYTGNPTLAGNVTITGNLTVNGTTTTINSTTVTVDDILLELGAVATPTDTTANGGGIKVLDAGTGKQFTWSSTGANWTSTENLSLATGKTYKINNVDIASGTGAALVLGANASTSLALGNTSGTTTINGTLSLNNPNKTMAHLMGYTSTVTSVTPVVLTNTSSYYQQFTGSTAQTITLPVTSTLATGWTFHLVNNNTSGNLTVNSSGGNLVITVPPGTTAMTTCVGIALTTAADWESGLTDFSTYTGSGNVVMATQPTLSSATLTTPIISSITNTGTLTLPTTTGTLALNPTTTTGDIVYASASGTPGTLTRLAGNITTQPSFLSSTGNASVNTTTAFTSSTGSGNVVLATSPTFSSSIIGSASMDVFNTISTTLNIGGAATSLAIGGTPITAVTGTFMGNATASTVTKAVNIGTGGASGSITNITLGSTTAGATGTTSITGSIRLATPPAVITATTYTVGVNDTVLIFNTTAACTVTMPSAATYPGRVIWMKQIAAFAVSSSLPNGNLGVQPLTSTAPGTAILSGAGKFAQLVSNGTDWVTMNAN